MHCPKCGAVCTDTATVCDTCGQQLAPASAGQPRTCGLAIAALVLGLASLVCLCVTGLPAIICAIAALVTISRSQGRLKGAGLAVAGLIISIVMMLVMFIAILVAMLMPALTEARYQAQRAVCIANVSGLAKCVVLYAEDNKGHYPAPDKWCDLIEPYAGTKMILRCPADPEGSCSYAMNAAIVNTRVGNPGQTVLVFECTPGWNQAGGIEQVITDKHRSGGRTGCNIGFMDGHAEFVEAERIPQLRWKIEGNQ